jgi:hypothetical protein
VTISAPFRFNAGELVGPFYNSELEKAKKLKSIFCDWHKNYSSQHTVFENNLQKHINQF